MDSSRGCVNAISAQISDVYDSSSGAWAARAWWVLRASPIIGGMVAKDIIAMRIAPDERMAVVAASSYLSRGAIRDIRTGEYARSSVTRLAVAPLSFPALKGEVCRAF
jgi:hypothetical protein